MGSGKRETSALVCRFLPINVMKMGLLSGGDKNRNSAGAKLENREPNRIHTSQSKETLLPYHLPFAELSASKINKKANSYGEELAIKKHALEMGIGRVLLEMFPKICCSDENWFSFGVIWGVMCFWEG